MSVQYTGAYSSSMKADTISLIPSEPYILNILLLAGFSLILRYRTSCVSPIHNVILLIVETSTGVLFVGVSSAGCEPDSRLGKKLKSKILLFNNIKIFSIFILLIKSLGYLIGFNFFFFSVFSASPSIWVACAKPVLFSY